MEDKVNNPSHYKFPNGAEVIQITRYLMANRAAAVKYLCRAGRKDDELQDLKKARFYIEDEIKRLENG